MTVLGCYRDPQPELAKGGNQMTTTRVRLWTVKEYHQMITAGVISTF
ncbi:MAG: hypothetical protein F6K41_19700 [Symploca sp. SIO3E6]|nr:hypothetical protein [Caldora sp. SIO3E6]